MATGKFWPDAVEPPVVPVLSTDVPPEEEEEEEDDEEEEEEEEEDDDVDVEVVEPVDAPLVAEPAVVAVLVAATLVTGARVVVVGAARLAVGTMAATT